MTNSGAPTDSAVLDRVRTLATDCCWTVALQVRRVQTAESEEPDYLSRQLADFQFLVVVLSRLRKAARLAQLVQSVSGDVRSAIAAFDAALPGLRRMRNVAEHIENYALNSPERHDKSVDWRVLDAYAYDENVFMWLGEQLNVVAAQEAADDLLEALKNAQRQHAMAV